VEVSGNLHFTTVLPAGKELPVRIGLEAKSVAVSVWMLRNREESYASAGNVTPAVQLGARCCTEWTIPAPYYIFIYPVGLYYQKFPLTKRHFNTDRTTANLLEH
jgi:hypothetical protein